MNTFYLWIVVFNAHSKLHKGKNINSKNLNQRINAIDVNEFYEYMYIKNQHDFFFIISLNVNKLFMNSF